MIKNSRPPFIIGNWKMHKGVEEAVDFLKELMKSGQPGENKIGLAVPYTVIYPLAQLLKEQTNESPVFLIGAQNMNEASDGAFTGEIAGAMLADAGAQFVLLGHSERRSLYNENDSSINAKIKKALENGLQAVLCIGETGEQREAGQTEQILEKQLKEGLTGIEASRLEKLIIAYEPVWAIGSGESASPQIAQSAHHFCRKVLADLFSEAFASKTVIQYGGSVNPSNAHELMAQEDIDGLLIGGASLSLESFLKIVNNHYSKVQSEG